MMQKIFYPLLTLLSIWFFAWGIPLDILDSYTIIIIIIGVAATTALFTVSVYKLFSPLNKQTDTNQEKFSGVVGPAMIIFFFTFSIFLIYHSINAPKREIETNGKYVLATVIDGSMTKTRKAEYSSIKIRFVIGEGKKHTVMVDIPSLAFKNYSKDQEIPIVYSPNYPSLIRLLHSDEEISKYLDTPIREININDLEHLFELETPEEINKYLNRVSQFWKISRNGEATIYFNNLKNIALMINPEGIFYLHTKVDPKLFEKELKRKKYILAPEFEPATYINDKFIVTKSEENLTTYKQKNIYTKDKYTTMVSITKRQD